ncbi:hypothetical protein G6L28_07485 [Agrobacterium larrymoorei]|uniref:hypothetical protein n=1 Tax=Agrobacterium larrymoorei TaxID=160699 RepID=UPI00157366B2|nr:hypothetical protein [Agrobacterium larrymoorei]NTJ42440.1 hypothetical protein [Agrobacterium larrymoorei]
MNDRCGPYVQMGILAERMAAMYQMDKNLELAPHLLHYMDEVDVNIASDSFDHVGFMTKIRDRVESGVLKATESRRRDFLRAVSGALMERIGRDAIDLARES